jgi:hypothetical protein
MSDIPVRVGMPSDNTSHCETAVAVSRWADKYTQRLENDLTQGWPVVANSVGEGINSLSLRQLAFGPGKDLQNGVIEPAVTRWVERCITPLIDDALEELQALLPKAPGRLTVDLPRGFDGERNLKASDFAKVAMLPAGPLVAGGAVYVAIATTTKLLVFTTVVVNWPLLVTGLAVAGVLTIFGTKHLACLKDELRCRIRDKLLPRLKDALVGEGIKRDGEIVPSLLNQLQAKIRETASEVRATLQT